LKLGKKRLEERKQVSKDVFDVSKPIKGRQEMSNKKEQTS